jgi:hypothetical protein
MKKLIVFILLFSGVALLAQNELIRKRAFDDSLATRISWTDTLEANKIPTRKQMSAAIADSGTVYKAYTDAQIDDSTDILETRLNRLEDDSTNSQIVYNWYNTNETNLVYKNQGEIITGTWEFSQIWFNNDNYLVSNGSNRETYLKNYNESIDSIKWIIETNSSPFTKTFTTTLDGSTGDVRFEDANSYSFDVPLADASVSNTITASNYLLLTSFDDSLNNDQTITGDWTFDRINPNYIVMTGGTKYILQVDDLGFYLGVHLQPSSTNGLIINNLIGDDTYLRFYSGEMPMSNEQSGYLHADKDLDKLNFVGFTGGYTFDVPIANEYVAEDITLTNITQITNRSHTSLSDIGSNTHTAVDNFISHVADDTTNFKTAYDSVAVFDLRLDRLEDDTTNTLSWDDTTSIVSKTYLDNVTTLSNLVVTPTQAGLGNLTNKLQIEREDSNAIAAGNYASPYWVDNNYSRILSSVKTKTSSYDILDTDVYILGDAESGDIILTLPAPNAGCKIRIKKIDNTNNYVTINPYASETIDGYISYSIDIQYVAVELFADGTNWYAN